MSKRIGATAKAGIIAGLVVIIVLSLRMLLAHMQVERGLAKKRAAMITLNHYIPSFDNLVAFINAEDRRNAGLGENYTAYYEHVVKTYPQLADPYMFLSFCYFHQGNINKAISALEAAAKLNGQFIWIFYDLGYIYLTQGQYQIAAQYFQQALKTSPQDSFNFMLTSKTYVQLMAAMRDQRPDLVAHIKQAYRDAYFLLNECLKAVKNRQVIDQETIARFRLEII